MDSGPQKHRVQQDRPRQGHRDVAGANAAGDEGGTLVAFAGWLRDHGALEHPPAHDERCAAVQPQAGALWCWALEGADPVRHLGGGVSVGADFVPPLPRASSSWVAAQ